MKLNMNNSLRTAAFSTLTICAISAGYFTHGSAGAYGAALILFAYWRWDTLFPVGLLPMWPIGTWMFVKLAEHTSLTADAALWSIDARLGYNPALAMALWKACPVIAFFAWHVYFEFQPLALTLAAVATGRPARFYWKFVTMSVLGFLIYCLVPACGPKFLLAGNFHAPLNAFPSQHLAWALLIRRAVGERGIAARSLGDLFVILTVCATLGLGEHYLIDLIAAMPFWCAFEWIWAKAMALRLPEQSKLSAAIVEGRS